ncbi:hypothetical protein SDC9_48015 [bioreactor metagenome]|uniref:DUF2933 domain-containing protein n=1 Tax=bioreactor metagenome TaxID=1076179 RepID=A0A644WD72_9ZZZZ
MSCHGNNKENNKENKGTHNHSPIKHMLHMILCCGLPILIFAALPFISRVSPGTSRILAVIAPFICPIMMLGMIPMMLGGDKNNKKSSCCESKESNSSTQLELNKPTE